MESFNTRMSLKVVSTFDGSLSKVRSFDIDTLRTIRYGRPRDLLSVHRGKRSSRSSPAYIADLARVST